ncbi:helix-turn-helix domain-containing protein [Kocuria atrinae]|uniref:helix-turn-helix domain-containing protein n=1 Tax=Kocuria atrinae TaxID=592377 RepID=UPI0003157ED3|nr:helix-turn-helix domain-containing protein [Kocuria atrinae]
MTERSIASARQLGAAIHDARRAAGLTQAELAKQAEVSREWLIGIEQGSRPRAELGKILDVLRVLKMSILLQPLSEKLPPTSNNATQPFSEMTRQALENIRPAFDPTALTRQALKDMRSALDPATATRQALENIRPAFDPTALTRQALKDMRSALDPATATRQALENIRHDDEDHTEKKGNQ